MPDLNGVYYGPSVPPSKSYHRPGHGGGFCCCNPFSCCCSCLFNCICTCLFQILCTLLVIIGVLALLLWLIFRPNKVNFHVADATLTQFDYSNNTLHYNLALNVSIRNPNKRLGIYYDTIDAHGLYHGQNFTSTNLEPFYQGHKNTTDLNVVFKGQNMVLLGNNEKSDYNEEKNSGVYKIQVKLYMRIRLKFGWFKTKKIKPMIKCDLKVPLKNNGTSSATFERTQCHMDW